MSRAFRLLPLLGFLAACSTPEGPLGGVTASAGGGVLLLDGKPANLSTLPIVTQAESRRSDFRLGQEAVLGNIDRAQPLQRRLTAVNVIAAEADLAATSGDTLLRQRRNFYVSALLVASDERCEAWFETLGETDRETNFVFGVISTITGVLGGIFTPAATARGLAGAAGISSGMRAEFNGTFFAQQTANALIDAIKKERALRRTDILGAFERPYSAWQLSRARVEVQSYHDLCSLPAGVRLIQDAVRRPPSLTLEETLRRQTYVNAATQFSSRCTQPNANKDHCERLQTVMNEFRPTREQEQQAPSPTVVPATRAPNARTAPTPTTPVPPTAETPLS